MSDAAVVVWVLFLLWAVGFVVVSGVFLARANVSGMLDRLERVALVVGWPASWARVVASGFLLCTLLLWPVVVLKMLWRA